MDRTTHYRFDLHSWLGDLLVAVGGQLVRETNVTDDCHDYLRCCSEVYPSLRRH